MATAAAKHPSGWQSGRFDSYSERVTPKKITEEQKREVDEKADAFKRTLGSNKPAKGK